MYKYKVRRLFAGGEVPTARELLSKCVGWDKVICNPQGIYGVKKRLVIDNEDNHMYNSIRYGIGGLIKRSSFSIKGL